MKIKAACFTVMVAMLLFCCSHKQVQQDTHFSFLHQLADSLSLQKDKNIIIYSINPNDCINCLYNFSEINGRLMQSPNSKLYVMLMEREIEKQELIRTTRNIRFTDSINKKVIWDKPLFARISAATGNRVLLSLLTVYNYKQDSILFCKPIKSIPDVREVEPFLAK